MGRIGNAMYVGQFFIYKYRTRYIETGDAGAVARQLRKQGVPLNVALKIIFGY
jgi:hypothetical protein